MIQELKLKEFNKRLERLPLAQKQQLIKKNQIDSSENLHVVYVMSHVGVSGGVKVIFEHVNRLKKSGVEVSIVSHFEKPTWYPIEADYIQVPFDLELAKGIPDCQVIVATYWDHIQACVETGIAPVVYFEQGDFHLFEYEKMNATLKKFITKQFELPEFIYTVSESTAQYIEEIYNREAKVIHNAIDETVFSDQVVKYEANNPYLLMVGAESAKFKGIKDIIEAYQIIKDTDLQLDLYWVTPEEPSGEMKSKVTKYFVQPNQDTIAQLYRGASVYVSGSHYESFSLPPLEAMACGCPVVTTNNKGVMEYAVHEENALISEMKSSGDIAENLKVFFKDKSLRENLIQNGLLTARKYSWDQITKEVLHFYKAISKYRVLPKCNLDEWDMILTENMFLQEEDFMKFEKFIQHSEADLVQVPVVYSMDDSLEVARWEVVASRKQPMNTRLEKCYCPVSPINPLAVLDKKAYQAFYKRNFDEAIDEFTTLLNESEQIRKPIYFRWIILCLYHLQRKYEAKSKLQDWVEQHHNKLSSELDFLSILLDGKKEQSLYEKICLLGDSASYPEFIFNIKNKLKEIIK
ncbi:glycosyltransferase family 4 protein [Pontibacillus sp. HMF3514]|uniref:glycosyltransferase family 4 protein n=1 Tax=Pontibacillus sp. HMF3514 TaxID=2692425 RepID=UPI00131F6B6F|nr:glycosyltransferase family 4 protein [Pontibacillus sp. HMF3514]QHE54104.1 glycosyltransferase [Pontibacillus sp. HMF3514]